MHAFQSLSLSAVWFYHLACLTSVLSIFGPATAVTWSKMMFHHLKAGEPLFVQNALVFASLDRVNASAFSILHGLPRGRTLIFEHFWASANQQKLPVYDAISFICTSPPSLAPVHDPPFLSLWWWWFGSAAMKHVLAVWIQVADVYEPLLWFYWVDDLLLMI